MSMRDTEGSSQGKCVGLSELLQLKKCERPGPEFWDEFERQLQRRQLKALVKPAWKDRLCLWGRRVASVAAPVTAAVFVGFLIWGAPADQYVEGQADSSQSSAPPELDRKVAAVDESPEPAPEVSREQDQPVTERESNSSFVYDAITPKPSSSQRVRSYRTSHRPEADATETPTPQQRARAYRTQAQPKTLHAQEEQAADYVVKTYELGSMEEFDRSPSLSRFRFHSDVNESRLSTRLEGGLSMQF